jgi:hypothetical protein
MGAQEAERIHQLDFLVSQSSSSLNVIPLKQIPLQSQRGTNQVDCEAARLLFLPRVMGFWRISSQVMIEHL